MEVNFINTLEAKNLRHEKQDSQLREEDRYQKVMASMIEQRQKKIDEKSAKESAAEQRRREAEEVLKYRIFQKMIQRISNKFKTRKLICLNAWLRKIHM